LFVVTGFAAGLYHGEERRLSTRWFGRGQTALAAGRAQEAIEDFRTALVYSRESGANSADNPEYDLSLARALQSAGYLDEARSYLLGLAERAPGNATVNLELARLAARQNDVNGAVRYYTAAIYGVWESDPVRQRQKARVELAEFLIRKGKQADAQSELIAMTAALPPVPADHVQAGQLLLRTGEEEQALKQFKIAFDEDRRAPGAFLGAGLVEFKLGAYAETVNYLERAEQQSPLDVDAAQALAKSLEVLELDPFTGNLSPAERSRRAARAFQLAVVRLQVCAKSRGESLAVDGGPSPLQQIYREELTQKEFAGATASALTRHPENLSHVMDIAFQIEGAVTSVCGEPVGADASLELIARNRAKAAQ
jgi:tetratricopeptide (TPR) repeat protein